MREAYEKWFKEKFGFPPMPIHSRAVDFCWEGYQAGIDSAERNRLSEHVYWQDQLRQQVTLLRGALNMWLVSPQGERNLAMHKTECVKSTLKAIAATEPKP